MPKAIWARLSPKIQVQNRAQHFSNYIKQSTPERPDLSKINLTAYLPGIPIFLVTQTTTI